MDEIAFEPEPRSRLKDMIAITSGCLLQVAFLIGTLVLLIAFFKGVPWIADNVYPWLVRIASLVLFIIVPISLLLAIFRKSRGIAGVVMAYSSYIIGASLWVWSLIVAYVLAGVFWMIVGILFGGVGVVPVAFIAALTRTEWSIAIQIGIGVIVVFGLRGFGTFLAERHE